MTKTLKEKKIQSFLVKHISLFLKSNPNLRWSHWKHFEAEEMLNHVRDKVFPFIKKLNSNSDNGFSAQMKDAVFIIPKPSLFVQAVEIIESLKIHEQNQDTQGDIYEYLLSELTTSGKNGQFRTPRHIIKMMCELISTRIGQTVCDPACGTGGFLIGAYQYILRQHTSPQLITTDEEGMEHGLIGDKITSNTIWNHLKNKTFYGFDFDSTMLRISAMNMALHGIKNPNIKYLDSISKNNKEENRYDVILANPPFKGNIDKSDIHEALSRTVKTTRTELLFIAQMMRLLKVGGQCAVIVPSGVLFRSDKAHTAIRKKIIEETQLEAVISMPSGVFKPYAGVSTAVLSFIKGGETDKVWFYDMTADGFSLDDKRNKIEENDIPDIIEKWNNRHKLKEPTKEDKWFFVNKKKIVENGDYSLNGRIYKEIVSYGQSKWPMVELGEVCEVNPNKSEIKNKKIKASFVPMSQLSEHNPYFQLRETRIISEVFNGCTYFKDNDVILAKKTPCFENGKSGIAKGLKNGVGFGSTEFIVLRARNKILPRIIYYLITSNLFKKEGIRHMTGSAGQKRVPAKFVKKYKIPLPPLEVQKEIVDEIEGYQKKIKAHYQSIKIIEKKIKEIIKQI